MKTVFCSFLLAVIVCSASGDQWPQWRGSNRDGVWHENGIVEKFDKERLDVRWRVKISNGYSGPTVASNRVYISDRLTKPSQKERVLCFDAMTGNEIWSYSYDCKYKNIGYPDGPRGSVTINDGRAYFLGTMGHFFCFDAATGAIIWQKDLNKEYKIRMATWGISASPLVEDGLVIVQIGGEANACLVAFDKISGQEKWRALGDRTAYSSPVIISHGGGRVLICWTQDRVAGLDPVSGKTYWEYPFGAEMGIVTPVVQDDFLFLSSFFDGCVLLKLKKEQDGVDLVWKRKGKNEKNTDGLHCCISTPLMLGDYIYGVDSYGELRCLKRDNGERLWENLDAVPKARWANIHMVRNGKQIWMFNERGELIISRLEPEGFVEISRTKIIDPTEGQLDQRGGVCWSHPAFAYKHIYARNDNELICVNLAASVMQPD
jgi:outer membrane protein assembly factor BamB